MTPQLQVELEVQCQWLLVLWACGLLLLVHCHCLPAEWHSGTQALRPDALAPEETPEHRERPSGDLQARDTISRMGGSKGITAAQFCFGCSEADLHFEAGPAVSGAGAGPSASNRTSTSSRVYLRDLSAISQQLAFS